MREYNVALVVVQTITAESAEAAEATGRAAIRRAEGQLWYPSVLPEPHGPTVEVD